MGFGDVVINVELVPGQVTTLELHEVLYCPHMPFNIIGGVQTSDVGACYLVRSLVHRLDILDKQFRVIGRCRLYKNVFFLQETSPPGDFTFLDSVWTKDVTFQTPLGVIQPIGEVYRMLLSGNTQWRDQIDMSLAHPDWRVDELQWANGLWGSRKNFFDAFGWDSTVPRHHAMAKTMIRLIRDAAARPGTNPAV